MTDVPARAFTVRATHVQSVLLATVGVGAALLAVDGVMRLSTPVTSDYGLVAVMPGTFWVGLAALHLVFGLALSVRKPNLLLVALLLALLVVLLFGAPALLDPTPRLEVSWRHLGIANELQTTGRVDPSIDAYFSWPGFFAGVATLLDVTPISPAALAVLAPTLNGLLWAFGVAALAGSLTPSRHHAWLAAWLFVVFNWIDQDYLSPQAFAFAVYLVVVTLLLRYLAAVPRGGGLIRNVRADGVLHGTTAWWRSREPVEPDPRRRSVALLLVMGLMAVVMISHQLSPFMLLGAIGLLTVTGRLWTPLLLAVAGLVAVLWLTTGASYYLAGHPVLFVQGLGDTAGANMAERVAGSPGHVMVVQVRSALTAATLALAALGWFRMRRQGLRDSRPLMLMVFPFLMVPLQSYGGEMLMRATLFSLPFLAYYAAGLFLAAGPQHSIRAHPTVILVAAAASAAVMTSHFGNAAFDMFTRAEVRGVQQLYRLAPPGTLLVTVTHGSSWKSQDYADYHYLVLTDACEVPLNARACYDVVHDRAFHSPAGAFVFTTRAERESLRIRGDAAPGVVERIDALLRRRAGARVVYQNEGIRILRIEQWSAGTS